MPDVELFALHNASRGAMLARRLYCPRRFWARNLGLLARPPLREGEALWLDPCGGIHTWGVRYPIDVLFLDRQHCILAVARQVRPWRVVLAPPGTRSVVELPGGGAAGAEAGDRLEMLPGGSPDLQPGYTRYK